MKIFKDTLLINELSKGETLIFPITFLHLDTS